MVLSSSIVALSCLGLAVMSVWNSVNSWDHSYFWGWTSHYDDMSTHASSPAISAESNLFTAPRHPLWNPALFIILRSLDVKLHKSVKHTETEAKGVGLIISSKIIHGLWLETETELLRTTRKCNRRKGEIIHHEFYFVYWVKIIKLDWFIRRNLTSTVQDVHFSTTDFPHIHKSLWMRHISFSSRSSDIKHVWNLATVPSRGGNYCNNPIKAHTA